MPIGAIVRVAGAVAKKKLKTINLPKGLPAPKKVPATTNNTVGQATKTVKGEVVKDSLPNKSKQALSSPKSSSSSGGTKKLPAPDNHRPDLLPKGKAAKRGGALGTAAGAATLLTGEAKPKKESSTSPSANTDSKGNSTKIEVKKGTPKPTKKPKTAAPSKPKSTKKSATRIAFEKEFAKNRKAGKKEFTFRGKRFHTKIKGEK